MQEVPPAPGWTECRAVGMRYDAVDIYIYISHWRHRTRAGFISLLLRGLHRKMRVLIPLVAAMPLVGCR
jgi:hypothetical protein